VFVAVSLMVPSFYRSCSSAVKVGDDASTHPVIADQQVPRCYYIPRPVYSNNNNNVTGSAREAGAAAELAASRKEEKYANIGSQYLFAPIAIETLGPLNTSACQLFGNLGRKISSSSDDDREGAFLFQRVSVLVQRFNAVLLHDSLPTPDCTD